MASPTQFLNVSGYRFIDLDPHSLPELREEFFQLGVANDIRGTILLAPEGINVMLCGLEDDLRNVLSVISAKEPFRDLWLKESWSNEVTFSRMLVKIKQEIIPVGDPTIKPATMTGRYLSPADLKSWYDEARSFVIIDTRNDYEVELGTFENAIDLGLETFRSIETQLASLDPSVRDQPVVTFCTGGVRCEKVTPMMMRMGFSDVYQLEGGIINYFERCGGEHFEGECFVFDKRVAIDGRLQETGTTQCYICQHVVTPDEQLDPAYTPGVSCPHCFNGDS